MSEKKILSRLGNWLMGEPQPSAPDSESSEEAPVAPGDLAAELAAVRERLQQRERLLESLRDQRNELLQNIRASENHIKALEAQLRQRPGAAPAPPRPALANDETAELSSSDAPAGDLASQIQQLNERLEQREKLLESLRDQRNELHKQLRGAEAHAKALESQAGGGASRSTAALASQVEQQKTVLDQFRRDKEAAEQRALDFETRVNRLNDAAEAATAHAQKLQQELNQVTADKEAAEQLINELNAQLQQSRAAAPSADPAAGPPADAGLASQLQQANETLEQLRREKEAGDQRRMVLESELDEMRARLEAATASLNQTHEQALDQLRQEKEDALARAAQLEVALSDTRVLAEATSQELDARQSTLGEELSRQNRLLAEAQAHIQHLTAELNAREQALSSTREASTEAARALIEAGRSSKELEQTASALSEAQRRAQQLEAELTSQKTLSENLQKAEIDITGDWEEAQAAPVDKNLAAREAAIAQAAAAPLPAALEETEIAVGQEKTAATAGKPAAPGTAPGEAASEKKKLLVAEDDPSIRRIIELVLVKAGLEIITARDGAEAFDKALAEKPDAVLTDLDMPKMTGLELVEKMKATPETRTIPVGFLTGLRDLENYKRALELGSTIYMTKPFRPDNLVMFVSVLMRGRKPRFWRAKPAEPHQAV